jgi:hypothetical protein
MRLESTISKGTARRKVISGPFGSWLKRQALRFGLSALGGRVLGGDMVQDGRLAVNSELLAEPARGGVEMEWYSLNELSLG